MKLKIIPIFIAGVLIVTFSACGTSYKATGLTNKSTLSDWNVSFDSLDGELTYNLKVKDGKPSILIVNSNIESGTLSLRAEQHDIAEDISLGHQEIDISEWNISNHVILSIIAESAEKGSITFTWQ